MTSQAFVLPNCPKCREVKEAVLMVNPHLPYESQIEFVDGRGCSPALERLRNFYTLLGQNPRYPTTFIEKNYVMRVRGIVKMQKVVYPIIHVIDADYMETFLRTLLKEVYY